jgi:hypothetical protein
MWVLVAHAFNPSYSGGRDQEDPSSKPAQDVWETKSGKYLTQIRAGSGSSGEALAQYHQ